MSLKPFTPVLAPDTNEIKDFAIALALVREVHVRNAAGNSLSVSINLFEASPGVFSEARLALLVFIELFTSAQERTIRRILAMFLEELKHGVTTFDPQRLFFKSVVVFFFSVNGKELMRETGSGSLVSAPFGINNIADLTVALCLLNHLILV